MQDEKVRRKITKEYVEMYSDSEGNGHGRQFRKLSGAAQLAVQPAARVMSPESPSCGTLLNGAKIRNAEKREFARGAAL